MYKRHSPETIVRIWPGSISGWGSKSPRTADRVERYFHTYPIWDAHIREAYKNPVSSSSESKIMADRVSAADDRLG